MATKKKIPAKKLVKEIKRSDLIAVLVNRMVKDWMVRNPDWKVVD
jgi:hypothetical protein